MTQIWCNGCTLEATEIEIDGVKNWVWIAVDLDEECFLNGIPIYPVEMADSLEDLVNDND